MDHEGGLDHLVLLSGGLDSAAALAFVKANGAHARAVFFDYGQPAAAQERKASAAVARHYDAPYEVLSVRHSASVATGELVGRNALLILAASCFVGPRRKVVVTGIHAGTSYYDCSKAFLTSIAQLMEEQSGGEARLFCPFSDWTKTDVASFAKSEQVPVAMTYSCEAGTVPPCGECASCRDRGFL